MLLPLIIMAATEQSSDDDSANDTVLTEEEPLLSTLDLFILCALIGFIIYWFFVRKTEPETTTIKNLRVVAPTTTMQDTSFINKMKHSGRNVVIFYGSQTGTAEEFAGRLSKDCSRYGMKGMVADPEECEMEELSKLSEIENSLAIFCVATYGEGDPTDNAQEFYEWLQQDDSDMDMTGINYAVFGLGNKTYEHYNSMGTFVDKRLEELGAKRVCELGLGDDDGNIEEDFVTWRERFWPTICEVYGVQPVGDEVSMRQYSLTVHDELEKNKIFTGEAARLGSFRVQRPPFDVKNPFLAPITVNRELHRGGDRSCMHIELDISGSKLRYDAGDHVALYPINDPEIVDAIGNRLNVDLDQVITLTNVDEEASKKHPFPCPTTYRTALSHYLDVMHPPRTHVLKELSEYCEDPKDKEFLQSLTAASSEAKHLYSEWVVQDHRNILAILEDIPSLNPPLDHICELLPKLQPRYYSISSSSKLHPTSIHITAVFVDWTTRTGRPTKGVATRWLKTKIPTNGLKPTVPAFIRKSQFRLPFKSTTPIIMIGPGTGLAPFRGFIQERHNALKEGKPLGDTVLYFGCRKQAEDFIYEDELRVFEKEGAITHLHAAFSRDQPHKVYVQHLMQQNKDEIWNVLHNNGHVYICGDARNMARDVHQTLVSVLKECGGYTEEQAEDYVKKMQSKGRYSADVWS